MHRNPHMRASIRSIAAIAATVGLLAITPSPAAAHGITSKVAGKSAIEFVPIGIGHMLLGWDHLLFIGGVVLLAGHASRAAKFISLFALGHSTTLIIATLAGWRLNATFVDVVIALSLVFVGVVGVRGRPSDWRPFGATVFVFGLIHGLGLSTRLQSLGLPENGLLGRVLCFNVGVEVGQLVGIAVMALLGALVTTVPKAPRLQTPAYAGLVLLGVAAAGYLAVTDSGDGVATVTTEGTIRSSTGSCALEEVEAPVVRTGARPAKAFYGPTETAPEQDFGYIVGDGLVVIRYAESLPAGEVAALKSYVTGTQYVVGGAVDDSRFAVRAINQSWTLTCAQFDLTAVQDFAAPWIQAHHG